MRFTGFWSRITCPARLDSLKKKKGGCVLARTSLSGLTNPPKGVKKIWKGKGVLKGGKAGQDTFHGFWSQGGSPVRPDSLSKKIKKWGGCTFCVIGSRIPRCGMLEDGKRKEGKGFSKSQKAERVRNSQLRFLVPKEGRPVPGAAAYAKRIPSRQKKNVVMGMGMSFFAFRLVEISRVDRVGMFGKKGKRGNGIKECVFFLRSPRFPRPVPRCGKVEEGKMGV